MFSSSNVLQKIVPIHHGQPSLIPSNPTLHYILPTHRIMTASPLFLAHTHILASLHDTTFTTNTGLYGFPILPCTLDQTPFHDHQNYRSHFAWPPLRFLFIYLFDLNRHRTIINVRLDMHVPFLLFPSKCFRCFSHDSSYHDLLRILSCTLYTNTSCTTACMTPVALLRIQKIWPCHVPVRQDRYPWVGCPSKSRRINRTDADGRLRSFQSRTIRPGRAEQVERVASTWQRRSTQSQGINDSSPQLSTVPQPCSTAMWRVSRSAVPAVARREAPPARADCPRAADVPFALSMRF